MTAVTKTQYFTATSIDGYVADAQGSLDWLFQVGADDGGSTGGTADTGGGSDAGEAADADGSDPFDAFVAGVGAFAMGATTYEWVYTHERLDAHPEKWREWYGDLPCWVFTHRDLPGVPGAALTFASGDVAPVHAEMVAAAGGKNVWLVGGGVLAAAFADAGLLDEMILGVAPVTLGGGAPVLPRHLPSSRLHLADVRRHGPFAYLTYRVTAARVSAAE